MQIERNEIRCFHAVVEAGGFSRAAERLDLSQSAVSQAIANLEHRLGAVLLRRALTPDRRVAVYTANAGSDPSDFDRRHLFSVSVTAPTSRPLTSGTGIEWSPVITGDGRTVAYLSADARRPPIPAVVPLEGGAPRLIAMEHIPADFQGN